MRQKEEEYDEVFKRSKLIERSRSKREEKENGKRNGLNELITILKELKNNLKEEIADLRKKVREMKEEWKTRAEGLDKRMDTMEKNKGNRKSNNR